MVCGMTTTFSFIQTGSIPTARALCSVSALFPGSRLESEVYKGVPAAVIAAAAAPKQLLILPLVDHFFAAQLDPRLSALASWLKEQIR
jgi:hypothetical protein